MENCTGQEYSLRYKFGIPRVETGKLLKISFLGSGPDRGQSPVEWVDFLSVRTYFRPPLEGSRASQAGLRPSQSGLRASQAGLRAPEA